MEEDENDLLKIKADSIYEKMKDCDFWKNYETLDKVESITDLENMAHATYLRGKIRLLVRYNQLIMTHDKTEAEERDFKTIAPIVFEWYNTHLKFKSRNIDITKNSDGIDINLKD